MDNPSFKHFDWKNGLLFNDLGSRYPSALYALVGENTFHFKPDSTYFLYQYEGIAYIGSAYPLIPGHYASCTERDNYVAGNEQCKMIIIERAGTVGTFLLGGPIEDKGRLKYIDGCTDSLLLAPWKYGEPCLNHLHFPTGINQTQHTHPSIRIGLVARGTGECVTPFGCIPLVPGMLFAIMPDRGREISTAPDIYGEPAEVGSHAFRTYDHTMDVIAFHPDSDFGPTDETHPMINRTIVNGVPANQIDEIRTKEITNFPFVDTSSISSIP